jgi:pyruvate/2-oxoglutarate dehydrogenase complex dihydrolipoamide acyltransferase (E2) component
MLGANGIVGGGFPLACGSALTAKYKKTNDVSVCFFGDGANNEGTFHEGLNLAAIWKLPVIFVAENNGYGEASTFEYASSCQTITDRAIGYNIPGVQVDGKDDRFQNLGAYGVEHFTPVLNTPETGILGVGSIQETPVYKGEELQKRSLLPLSLTFDHRVLDGAPTAEFLRTVKKYLEQPI